MFLWLLIGHCSKQEKIGETTNGSMSWSHEILIVLDVAVKCYTTLCKFGHLIYYHVCGPCKTMRRPYDTSAWDGKGGHTTNDTHAANVTALHNR